MAAKIYEKINKGNCHGFPSLLIIIYEGIDICRRCLFMMADARPGVAKYIYIEQMTGTINGNTEKDLVSFIVCQTFLW